jgi:hypothetical protein
MPGAPSQRRHGRLQRREIPAPGGGEHPPPDLHGLRVHHRGRRLDRHHAGHPGRLPRSAHRAAAQCTQSWAKPFTLNRGLEVSRAEDIIARQDADDLSYPTRLEQEVAFLEAHPQVGLLGTAYDVMDAEGHWVGRVSPPTDNETLQRTLVRHNCFGHGSVMMRREVLCRVGGYAADMPAVEDYELYLRLAECVELANLAEPLYAWRRHTVSITPNGGKLGYDQLRLIALQRMLARRVEPQPGVPGWAPEDLAAARVALAVSAALLEEWDTARNALQEAWQLAGDWLCAGAFAEVVEEGLWGAAGWAGWDKIFAVFEQLLACLPTGVSPLGIRAAVARLYRHQAFEAHVRGQPQQVRQAAWEYWRRRPLSLFTDRGMASIWLQSWRRRAHA